MRSSPSRSFVAATLFLRSLVIRGDIYVYSVARARDRIYIYCCCYRCVFSIVVASWFDRCSKGITGLRTCAQHSICIGWLTWSDKRRVRSLTTCCVGPRSWYSRPINPKVTHLQRARHVQQQNYNRCRWSSISRQSVWSYSVLAAADLEPQLTLFLILNSSATSHGWDYTICVFYGLVDFDCCSISKLEIASRSAQTENTEYGGWLMTYWKRSGETLWLQFPVILRFQQVVFRHRMDIRLE